MSALKKVHSHWYSVIIKFYCWDWLGSIIYCYCIDHQGWLCDGSVDCGLNPVTFEQDDSDEQDPSCK